jgi:predicted GIY-YIG superfamily endonuclease
MKFYVYILRSKNNPGYFYIGYTANFKRRIKEHLNSKATAYTRQYAPWKLETYVVFRNKDLAKAFEVYLKSHSGRAFLKKRLISSNT